MSDDLQRVIDKYGNQKFGDLDAVEQSEYLSALANRGGIAGATSVLNKLGLNDDDAPADIRDIRDLLRGFRVVRSRAFNTIFGALGRLFGWVVIIGLLAIIAKSDTGKTILHAME